MIMFCHQKKHTCLTVHWMFCKILLAARCHLSFFLCRVFVFVFLGGGVRT
uniref:Uncharacterized protein n=1 Tax=Anguilla anguilla TaxID=7936 RepID=A0A0E9QU69_ANGAN